MMKSSEKLTRALEHEDGPVPIDFGSTAVTGIHVSIVGKLRDYYGLEKRPVKVNEPYQMLGEVEPDLREAMSIDVVGAYGLNTIFGFPLGNWKEWRAPWGQELLVPGNFNVSARGKDVVIYPEGDTTVPASGRMPEGGFFFDTIIRQEPIDEEKLDPKDNLEEFGPASDEELQHMARESEKAAKTGCGVIANFGNTGFGDIALVPGPFLKKPKGIRDVAEWYMSTAGRKDYVRAVFDKQLEYALQNLPKFKEAAGDRIHVLFICGTDFGTQESQFCSPAAFEELWLPCYKSMNDWIHENTSWKTFKHSCGAVEPLMELFIKAGFDVINPVQCSAAGMDPGLLKSRYGDRLVFWGGGVDTQSTLPFGTPEQVRQQVLKRCEVFSGNGGFVFNTIHNVQAKSPVENVAAMIEAVKEFNGRENISGD
ncbi:MAG: uroporphyrinogen decarboxylase family protein [Kiritimatiellia bacterium]